MLAIKRIYDPPSPDDGQRILVDRLWPRGLTKEAAAIDRWLKDIAPSNELRKWAHSQPERWSEFQDRYWEELRALPDAVATLRQAMAAGKVTLLYAGKNETHNNAVALRTFLEPAST